MLTRLRVQGFKSLLDVEIRLGPFTCIAGMNAVGKSNLFDAVRFLHLLTQVPIMEAVKLLRESKGRSPEPRSLFTTFGVFRAPEMRFEAEMLVGREVEDELGVSSTAAISSLRYELAFRLADGDEGRLELVYESLEPIKVSEARQSLGFRHSKEFLESAVSGVRRGGAFISTDARTRIITVHQEKHGGRKVPAPKSSRTVVGASPTSDFPTVLAAHREMESWRTMLLEPSAMRAPSFYGDARALDARGANLPATLKRLESEGPQAGRVLSALANRLSELVEDVQELRIQDDAKTETLTAELLGRDGVFRPARSLSDGTLRFLVLAALALDPEVRGVICLEEPENGIHPDRIPAMVRLLRDIAVDPVYRVDQDNPLRQVIINTHSPKVVENIGPDDLVYFEAVEKLDEGGQGRITQASFPQKSWRARLGGGASTVPRGYLRSYLRPEQMELWASGSNVAEGDQ